MSTNSDTLASGQGCATAKNMLALEVLCELGNEQLTKNVRVHVHTITLGGLQGLVVGEQLTSTAIKAWPEVFDGPNHP